MVLTEEMERALNLGRKGHSFYLEGKTGTGKTVGVKELYTCLKKNIQSVGSNHQAAKLYDDLPAPKPKTVHSYFGLGFGQNADCVLLQQATRIHKVIICMKNKH